MRRALLVVLVGVLLAPVAARAADIDPVRLTVTLPAAARSGSTVAVTVAVAADAGALDPRAGTLRVGVRLAAECGGSFATTPAGPTPLDAVALAPQPAAGAAYSGSVRGTAAAPAGTATLTACVFLLDDEGRQLATDTDSAVSVSPSGPVNPGGDAPGGGGGGTSAGCTPSVSAPATVRRGARLAIRYRACAKGRHRFTLLKVDGRATGHGHRATITTTGNRTTKLSIGRLATGRYRLVMVLPSGRHVRAARSVRVLQHRR